MAAVLAVEWLTSDVFELVVERESLEYRAGACTLLIRDDQVDSRPYSFSSHPDQPELRFLIKRLPAPMAANSFSRWLSTLKPGDQVGVGTPFGLFAPGSSAGEVWLATGTGVAPFLSCLRAKSPPAGARLYWGLPLPTQAYFGELLESRSRVEWRFSRGAPSRRVSVEEPGFPLDPEREYFVCGNGAMVRACRDALQTLGIAGDRIHEESFFG